MTMIVILKLITRINNTGWIQTQENQSGKSGKPFCHDRLRDYCSLPETITKKKYKTKQDTDCSIKKLHMELNIPLELGPTNSYNFHSPVSMKQ